MPVDPHRRDDIVAAVAAHDSVNPRPLPRNAARLLAVMFPSEDVCQRSQEAIAAEGFSLDRLPAMLRRLGRSRLPVAAPGGSGARHVSAAPPGAGRRTMTPRASQMMSGANPPPQQSSRAYSVVSIKYCSTVVSVAHDMSGLGSTRSVR
jgi:hypothetical protein